VWLVNSDLCGKNFRIWPAPRKIPRIIVEFVTRRRRTNEREPVQQRTNHPDFARGGGRTENCRSMSPARDRRSDTVQVESEVWPWEPSSRRRGSGKMASRSRSASGTNSPIHSDTLRRQWWNLCSKSQSCRRGSWRSHSSTSRSTSFGIPGLPTLEGL
jgi:hypothetical protein